MFDKYLLIVYISYLIVLSIITFIIFGIDKKKAIDEPDKRIKEKTLLLFVVLGGGIGAFIGRLIFRHKLDKFYFSVVIFLSILSEIGILILYIINMVCAK